MLKYLYYCLLFLLSACAGSTGQTPEVFVDEYAEDDDVEEVFLQGGNEYIDSIAGYNVLAYEIYGPTYLGLTVPEMNKDHLLIIATGACDTAMVRRLLNDGANPNIELNTVTALTEAMFCEELSIPTYDLLIAGGADPQMPQLEKEESYYRPLTAFATRAANRPLLDHLAKTGLDLDESDRIYGMGCRPIHFAPDSATLQFFFDRDITLEKNCVSNRTILHNAVLDVNYQMVDYLLFNNLASLNDRDNDGDNAYTYAEYSEDTDMLDVLEYYMQN